MEQGDKSYIQGLIVEALNMVVHGDADRAVWRLVDAAALIGQASEDKTLGGFGERPRERALRAVAQ